MTIKEFQLKLERSVTNINTFSKPLQIAAFTATAKMGERIFDEGKKADESPIINHKAGPGATQHYSEKPIYVSKAAIPSPKGAPTGKPSGKTRKKKVASFVSDIGSAIEVKTIDVAVGGKSKFKDGKSHKSKYFATGYKGYRENVGRQTAFIDLKLSGELRLDFGNDKQVAEPRKINDLEYQIRLDKDINQKKREGIEERYGEIFSLSEQEREVFLNTMQFEFNNRLFKSK